MKFLPVHWYETLPSTNRHLREMIRETPTLEEGTVIAARFQTEGRGRFDRQWVTTPAGGDLAFSFALREASLERMSTLPLIIGLAVADAMARLGIISRVKWPNDVLTPGGKICGILCECVQVETAYVIIVGIGINVNMDYEIACRSGIPASSVRIETGQLHNEDRVLDGVLERISEQIGRWRELGFEAVKKEWLRCSGMEGRSVTVNQCGKGSLKGTMIGLGNAGQLLLRDEFGTVHEITEGDTSIGSENQDR